MQEMKKHRVTRDGQKDLEFEGVLLASTSTQEHQGPNNTRWNEAALYKTKGGKYVLHREYITRWQGEDGDETAEVYDTVEDLVANITDADGGISNMYKQLVEEAAEDDDAFKGVMVERIE